MVEYFLSPLLLMAGLPGRKKSVYKKSLINFYCTSPQSCRDVDQETVAVAKLIAVKKGEEGRQVSSM